MIPVCNCADGQTIQNFGGYGSCADGIGVPVNAILMSSTKVDGSANGINTETDTLDQAFFDSKFNDSIVEDRWLLLRKLEEFDSPPVEPTVEDFDSGSSYKIHDNAKEVTFTIVTKEAYKLAAKIKASECRDLSIMYNDDLDNLVGDLRDSSFTGRKIQNGSFDVQVVDSTFSTFPKVQVKFKYDRSALESAVDYIKQSSMNGYSIQQDAEALADVRITYGTADVNSVTFTLKTDFGGVESRIGAGGLTTANLEIYNVTDAAVEPVSSITETALGVYTATYTAPVTVADVIEVRGIGQVYVQKSYDLKALVGQTVTTA